MYLENIYLPVLFNMYTMFIQYSECTSCAVRLKCIPPTQGPKTCRETVSDLDQNLAVLSSGAIFDMMLERPACDKSIVSTSLCFQNAVAPLYSSLAGGWWCAPMSSPRDFPT